MNVGILGLKSSGKTTLFSSFIDKTYDEVIGKINIGSVNIPDERLLMLSGLYKLQKTIHANVNFEDCLPLDTAIKNDKIKLADSLKAMDAFACVVGAYKCYNTEEILKEIEKIRTELVITDLDFVIKRIERLDKEIKLQPKNRDLKEIEKKLLKKIEPVLENGEFLSKLSFDDHEQKMMISYNFLTLKPSCYILNISEKMSSDAALLLKAVKESLEKFKDNSYVITVNAFLESEIACMPNDDKKQFMKEYGIEKSGKDSVIQAAFNMLDLITFFTVGEDECRAWTLKKNSTALMAAGAIHSDLERGFIRAEVIDYKDLIEAGSLNEAKKRGILRLEGKTYIVEDGEMVHIMFNV